MSVVGVTPATFFPVNGQPDPRLPLGRWSGNGTIVGDGSAGSAAARLIFAGATAINSPVFSLDFLMGFRDDQGVDTTVLFEALGFSYLPNVVLASLAFPVPLINSAGGARVDTSQIQFPMFLGTRQVGTSNPTAVELLFDTNTNLANYSIQANGHYWSLDSLQLPGGPLRPENVQAPTSPIPGGQSYYDRLRAGIPGGGIVGPLI